MNSIKSTRTRRVGAPGPGQGSDNKLSSTSRQELGAAPLVGNGIKVCLRL